MSAPGSTVTMAKLAGSFATSGKQGANSLRFSGRLRNRKLKPAFYRLVATPRDPAGNVGALLRTKFRIVR